MFKKAKVVMLSTNEKAIIGLNPHNNKLVINSEYYNNKFVRFAEFNGKEDLWRQAQHLYIVSNEEIKEGDWYICRENNYKPVKNTSHNFKYDDLTNCRKVIASTDPSLSLPQPSQSFITKYIEEYNKGNIIEDVMVEYEDIEGDIYKCMWTRQYGDPDYMVVGKNNITRIEYNTKEYDQGIAIRAVGFNSEGKCIQQFGTLNDVARYTIDCWRTPSIIKLKVNSKDNTITIKKAKDSWTREEVMKLIEDFTICTNYIPLNKHPEREIAVNNWIEQHL